MSAKPTRAAGHRPERHRASEAERREDAARARHRDRPPAHRGGVAGQPRHRHRDGEARERERGDAGARADRLVEVDGAPVGRRALGEEAAEGEHGQREEPPRRPDEAGRHLGPVDIRRQEQPLEERPRHADGDRHDEEVHERVDARPRPRARRPPPRAGRRSSSRRGRRRGSAARTCPRRASEWAFIATSSIAAAAPNANSATTSAGRLGASARNGRISAKTGTPHAVPGLLPTRATVMPASGSASSVPSAAAKSASAELRLAQPELALDRRDARHPRPEDGAVRDEGERDREAGAV